MMRAALAAAASAAAMAILALAGCGGDGADPAAGQPASAGAGQARVLVVTRTAGFRHDSIPAATAALRALGRASAGYDVVVDNRPGRFTPAGLAGFDAVVFALTSGELPLTGPQRAALIRFVQRGGGFVGLHSATDTLYEYPPYERLVGAYFRDHPYTEGRLRRVGPRHPATAAMPAALRLRGDELYRFRTDPRATGKRILLRLDPATVPGAEPGEFLPIAWCGRFGRGRTFYNALGHDAGFWSVPWFRRHLDGALAWAAGERAAAACPRA